MPQIDWTPEFKRNTTVEFDRLKLKVGERARIVCMEKPTFTFVHTLRGPKIVDGRANKVIKKRKDGTEFADWDMDFVGRPQCLGDHGIIMDTGMDPKNCPVCARAQESEEMSAPERRFAMNIIKYNTKADGTPVTPFGCSAQVWTFTEGVYNKLYAIAQEYGGLVGHDLILGPCEPPETYQKFPITGGARDLWNSDDKVKNIVVETFKNNKLETTDLETACGRRVELRWLKEDIEKIRNRWRTAHGEVDASPTAKQDVDTLKGELDSLLAPPPVKVESEVGTPVEERVPETATKTVVKDETDGDKRETTGGSEPDDFSKLLVNLNL